MVGCYFGIAVPVGGFGAGLCASGGLAFGVVVSGLVLGFRVDLRISWLRCWCSVVLSGVVSVGLGVFVVGSLGLVLAGSFGVGWV